MGCEALGLKDENFFHQVADVQKDDFFVIENKKNPAFVYFSIEGTLSHDAKILWSDSAPDKDSVFTASNQILLPKGKISMSEIQGDYYTNKLYVKYVSLNDSTAGNVRIKIKI